MRRVLQVWRRDEGSPSPMPHSLRIPGFDDEPEAVPHSPPDPAQDSVLDLVQDQQDTKGDAEEEKQSQKDKSKFVSRVLVDVRCISCKVMRAS